MFSVITHRALDRCRKPLRQAEFATVPLRLWLADLSTSDESHKITSLVSGTSHTHSANNPVWMYTRVLCAAHICWSAMCLCQDVQANWIKNTCGYVQKVKPLVAWRLSVTQTFFCFPSYVFVTHPSYWGDQISHILTSVSTRLHNKCYSNISPSRSPAVSNTCLQPAAVITNILYHVSLRGIMGRLI